MKLWSTSGITSSSDGHAFALQRGVERARLARPARPCRVRRGSAAWADPLHRCASPDWRAPPCPRRTQETQPRYFTAGLPQAMSLRPAARALERSKMPYQATRPCTQSDCVASAASEVAQRRRERYRLRRSWLPVQRAVLRPIRPTRARRARDRCRSSAACARSQRIEVFTSWIAAGNCRFAAQAIFDRRHDEALARPATRARRASSQTRRHAACGRSASLRHARRPRAVAVHFARRLRLVEIEPQRPETRHDGVDEIGQTFHVGPGTRPAPADSDPRAPARRQRPHRRADVRGAKAAAASIQHRHSTSDPPRTTEPATTPPARSPRSARHSTLVPY